MKQLPPGQVETLKFPLVGEKEPPADLTTEQWQLDIDGAVKTPLSLNYQQFMALPQKEIKTDIHCVTSWSLLGQTFSGIPLADLLERVVPQNDAEFVRFVAYSDRNHDTSLPLDFARENCWLVHSINGQPLTPNHGYPLRLLTLKKYFYKSLKWLRRIELIREDRLGYWEINSAYHNEADPWQEQRFDLSQLSSKEEVSAFKEADDYQRYRKQVLLGANLSNWQPRSKNMQGVLLKSCRFRNAKLADVDFRQANLTLGKFWGADLRETNFSGADLEGADFSGADLRNATMQKVALSSTRFFRETKAGKRIEANVEGLRLSNYQGLLEDQEAFLREKGVVE